MAKCKSKLTKFASDTAYSSFEQLVVYPDVATAKAEKGWDNAGTDFYLDDTFVFSGPKYDSKISDFVKELTQRNPKLDANLESSKVVIENKLQAFKKSLRYFANQLLLRFQKAGHKPNIDFAAAEDGYLLFKRSSLKLVEDYEGKKTLKDVEKILNGDGRQPDLVDDKFDEGIGINTNIQHMRELLIGSVGQGLLTLDKTEKEQLSQISGKVNEYYANAYYATIDRILKNPESAIYYLSLAPEEGRAIAKSMSYVDDDEKFLKSGLNEQTEFILQNIDGIEVPGKGPIIPGFAYPTHHMLNLAVQSDVYFNFNDVNRWLAFRSAAAQSGVVGVEKTDKDFFSDEKNRGKIYCYLVGKNNRNTYKVNLLFQTYIHGQIQPWSSDPSAKHRYYYLAYYFIDELKRDFESDFDNYDQPELRKEILNKYVENAIVWGKKVLGLEGVGLNTYLSNLPQDEKDRLNACKTPQDVKVREPRIYNKIRNFVLQAMQRLHYAIEEQVRTSQQAQPTQAPKPVKNYS